MKMSKYELFLIISQAGTFSRAAKKLNYTQSAISQQVQSLEKDLGVPLLHRGKKGLVLTPQGQRLLPYFQEICAAESHLRDALFQTANHLTGSLRIGATDSVASYLLPQIIQEFRQKYPMVDYRITNGNYKDIEEMIVSGQVDLGFICSDTEYQLDKHDFPPLPLHVLLPENHPLATRSQLVPKDLDGEDFILVDDGYSRDIAEYFAAHQIKPKIALRAKGNFMQFGFIANGLGISLIPEPIVAMLPAGIVWRPLSTPPHRSISIACSNHAKLTLTERLFYDEVILFMDKFKRSPS